jgi:hypothetical protein
MPHVLATLVPFAELPTGLALVIGLGVLLATLANPDVTSRRFPANIGVMILTPTPLART